MLNTPPPRGAFDYLLEPIRDQLDRGRSAPPPPRVIRTSEGSGRAHIKIEIVDRRQPLPRRGWFARFVWSLFWVGCVLFLVGLLVGCQAHAQTTEQTWRNGNTTYFSGYAAGGAWWNGSQYRLGSTVHTDSYGDGRSQHCTTTTLGTTTTTECSP